MTASLTPAAMPARHLGPVPIFQWPLVWAMICLLLAVDFVWASQVGLTVGGIEIEVSMDRCLARAFCGIPSPHSRYSEHGRGIGFVGRFQRHWLCVLTYLAASCALPLQDVMMERLDRALASIGQLGTTPWSTDRS